MTSHKLCYQRTAMTRYYKSTIHLPGIETYPDSRFDKPGTLLRTYMTKQYSDLAVEHEALRQVLSIKYVKVNIQQLQNVDKRRLIDVVGLYTITAAGSGRSRN